MRASTSYPWHTSCLVHAGRLLLRIEPAKARFQSSMQTQIHPFEQCCRDKCESRVLEDDQNSLKNSTFCHHCLEFSVKTLQLRMREAHVISHPRQERTFSNFQRPVVTNTSTQTCPSIPVCELSHQSFSLQPAVSNINTATAPKHHFERVVLGTSRAIKFRRQPHLRHCQ